MLCTSIRLVYIRRCNWKLEEFYLVPVDCWFFLTIREMSTYVLRLIQLRTTNTSEVLYLKYFLKTSFFVVVYIVEPFVYFCVVYNVKTITRTLGSVIVIINWERNDFKYIQSKSYMLTKASFHSHLGKGQMILKIIEVAVWRSLSLAEFQAIAMRFTTNVLLQGTRWKASYLLIDLKVR